jgi:RNA-directed DNA polymerase
MNRLETSARQLALSILDTPWEKALLTDLLSRALGGGPPDPSTLAARLFFHCGTERCPSFFRLVEVLTSDDEFRQRFSRPNADKTAIQLQLQPTSMQAVVSGLVTLPLPLIPTAHDLAMWLGVSDTELEWFSGINRRQDSKPDSRLHHYHYEWQARTHGHERLLEKPKQHLKALQRSILREILDRVPIHASAHGFCRGRSCRSSVMPHLGKDLLLRLDLKDFFPSINRARVQAVFHSLGYPSGVSRTLAGLCTHRTSAYLAGKRFRKLPWDSRELLNSPHLPQGAPTSPALANLCAWHLDARLQGLARRLDLHYTRYADDLAFSGTINRRYLARVVQPLIGAIALEEGFRLNYRKTRLLTAAQRQSFCGITTNVRPNLARVEYERLRATLFNCVIHGPASQNRARRHNFRQHLQGRVSHVCFLNPGRGEKLQALMQQIRWD